MGFPIGFRQISGGAECPSTALSCVFTSILKPTQNEADVCWNQLVRETIG